MQLKEAVTNKDRIESTGLEKLTQVRRKKNSEDNNEGERKKVKE